MDKPVSENPDPQIFETLHGFPPGPTVPSVTRSQSVWLPFVGTAPNLTQILNDTAQTLADLIRSHPDQQRNRATIVWDQALADIARIYRAEEMVAHQYVGHINPQGSGPNQVLQDSNIELPNGYDRSWRGNNIESISSGGRNPLHQPDATLILQSFAERGTAAHWDHLMGRNDFFRGQTRIGIGLAVIDPKLRNVDNHVWSIAVIWTLHPIP
jgi:hypothetical protein